MDPNAKSSKATESLKQLTKHATIPWNPDISFRVWCNSADKLYSQAALDKDSGDLENSYIHYLKFLSLVLEYLPKHKEYSQYKRDLLVTDLMKKATESMSIVESLKSSISKKYIIPQIAESTAFINGDSIIDIDSIIQLIKKNPTSILFMDIRKSDINNSIKTENIIRFPPDQVIEGIHANDLESLLPVTKRSIFQRRETFEYIILFDDSSNFESDNPIFQRIIQAIYYMEFNKIPKRIPYILQGGWNSIKDSDIIIEYKESNDIDIDTNISEFNEPRLEMRPYPKLADSNTKSLLFPRLDVFKKEASPIIPPKPFNPFTITEIPSAPLIAPRKASPNPKDILREVMKHQIPLTSQSALGASSSGISGLKNLGNTCFMSSILQCCSSALILTRYFLSGIYRKHVNRRNKMGTGGILTDAYYQLLRSIWSGEASFYSPVHFKQAICRFANRFDSNEQQDSQEFMAFFLDGLHEDLNWSDMKSNLESGSSKEKMNDVAMADMEWEKYLQRNFSVIVGLFQGQLRSMVTCCICSQASTTFNAFMYLSLPINDSDTSLSGCMNMFLNEEILDGDNAWHCPNCKTHRKATKKLDLWRLPQILIIHLKRFSYQGPFRDKLETSIDFPITGLDMNWTVKTPIDHKRDDHDSYVYDLFAISNHYGGLNGGHYKATCFIEPYQRWYMFDDTRVSNVQSTQIKASIQ